MPAGTLFEPGEGPGDQGAQPGGQVLPFLKGGAVVFVDVVDHAPAQQPQQQTGGNELRVVEVIEVGAPCQCLEEGPSDSEAHAREPMAVARQTAHAEALDRLVLARGQEHHFEAGGGQTPALAVEDAVVEWVVDGGQVDDSGRRTLDRHAPQVPGPDLSRHRCWIDRTYPTPSV